MNTSDAIYIAVYNAIHENKVPPTLEEFRRAQS